MAGNPNSYSDFYGLDALPAPNVEPIIQPVPGTPTTVPNIGSPSNNPSIIPEIISNTAEVAGQVIVGVTLMCIPSNHNHAGGNCADQTTPPRDNCNDGDDGCDKEWREARNRCRQLIFEEMEQAAGRKKKRSVTKVTGGYKDVEECAKGLVSQRCGGNKIDNGTKKFPYKMTFDD